MGDRLLLLPLIYVCTKYCFVFLLYQDSCQFVILALIMMPVQQQIIEWSVEQKKEKDYYKMCGLLLGTTDFSKIHSLFLT